MVTQNAWIAISIAVFFAGLTIGLVSISGAFLMHGPAHMQAMMSQAGDMSATMSSHTTGGMSGSDSSSGGGMGGMMGGGGGHGSSGGGMGGMMGGGGGPSRHGVFYAPGSVHQICHMKGDMPPHYCEPYYKAMSSVKGVKISNVEPVSDNQIRVTLLELSADKPGVNSAISVNAGAGPLSGTTMVPGGWNDRITVDLTLEGASSIYAHDSMHVHIFPGT